MLGWEFLSLSNLLWYTVSQREYFRWLNVKNNAAIYCKQYMHKSQISCSDTSWKFVVKMQHVDISHLVCRFAMVLVSWANSSYFLINLLVCSAINFLHHQSHWATHPLVRRISQDYFLAMILWRNWNAGFPLPMQVFDEYVYFSCSFYPIEKKLGIHFQWCQIPSGVEVYQIWRCTSQSH